MAFLLAAFSVKLKIGVSGTFELFNFLIGFNIILAAVNTMELAVIVCSTYKDKKLIILLYLSCQ